MLEIDETTLKAITSAIDEVLSLIEGNKDIRIVAALLPKVSNRIRAMAEIVETPDNRFVQFLVSYLFGDFHFRVTDEEEDWYRLNKESLDQCMLQLKNFLMGLKSTLTSKSFEKTIDTIKMFYFAYYEVVLRIT